MSSLRKKVKEMRVIFFLCTCALVSSALIVACGGGGEAPEKKPVPPAAVFMEKSYSFSSAVNKDKFYLGLNHPDAASAQYFFAITSPAGDTVFSKRFHSSDIMPDSIRQGSKDRQTEYCVAWMKNTMDAPAQNGYRILFPDRVNAEAAGMPFALTMKSEVIYLWWSKRTHRLETATRSY